MFAGGYIGLAAVLSRAKGTQSKRRALARRASRSTAVMQRPMRASRSAPRPRRSSGRSCPSRTGAGTMSELGRRTRSARGHSGLFGTSEGGACGTRNLHSARPPCAVPGEPFEPSSIGALFLPRLRGHRRSGGTDDPILSRFSSPYRWLAAALGELGPIAEAKEALDKAIAVSPASFDFQVRNARPVFGQKTTPTCSMD